VPQLDFVGFDAVEELRNFQVGFAEISKRVKIAAGIIYTYSLLQCIQRFSFIPVWSTSRGMGGVPPSHNTVILLCAVSFLLNHDPDLRIFSPRTLQIRALTA
jgi:hypothetical protein